MSFTNVGSLGFGNPDQGWFSIQECADPIATRDIHGCTHPMLRVYLMRTGGDRIEPDVWRLPGPESRSRLQRAGRKFRPFLSPNGVPPGHLTDSTLPRLPGRLKGSVPRGHQRPVSTRRSRPAFDVMKVR